MKSKIDQLIINSPYEAPEKYWIYDRETRSFTLKTGRRPAGYMIASPESKGQETERDRTKREFLNEWVTAVNYHGGFGTWRCAISRNPTDVAGILMDCDSAVDNL